MAMCVCVAVLARYDGLHALRARGSHRLLPGLATSVAVTFGLTLPRSLSSVCRSPCLHFRLHAIPRNFRHPGFLGEVEAVMQQQQAWKERRILHLTNKPVAENSTFIPKS